MTASTDPLDDLLERSAPHVPDPRPGLCTGLTTMARAARRAARSPSRPGARLVLGMSLAAALLGGAGVAAANDEVMRDWFGPMRDPYVTYVYTAPSGAVCEERIGDAVANDPAAVEALRRWLRSVDVVAIVDVDAALAQLRSYGEHREEHVGSDAEYQMAMGIAIVLAARAELERQGFAPGSIDETSGDGRCADPAS